MSLRLKSNKLISLHRGFTLIEIMLVILVVALLTLYAVRIMNESLLRSQINRTDNQIISIEQALVGYYSLHNSNWPNPLTNLSVGTPATQTSAAIPIMLPATALCSPFIGSSTTCGAYAAYQGQPAPSQQRYYILTLQVPSPAIAQKLIASISNSWITNNTTVNIAVMQPASANPRNHGWIVSAGTISTLPYLGAHNANGHSSNTFQTGSQVYLPNCPSGYEGHIFFSPERYETNGSNWGIHLAQTTINLGNGDNSPPGSNQFSIVYSPMASGNIYKDKKHSTNNAAILNHFSQYQYQTQDRFGNPAYAVAAADVPDQNQNYIQHMVFYMTFCLPINHWTATWISSGWEQDGQCSTSWNDYLQQQGQTNPPTPNCTNDDSPTVPNGLPPVGSADAY